MFKNTRFSDRIIATHDIDPRPAQYAPIPQTLHPALHEALRQRGISQLYSHQAQMIDHALQGKNVVITTGTASGKSLAFLLPVLQTLMNEPGARAFLLYPTKALARDQLRAILRLAEELRAGGEGGR
ncbi:MAG: DEAD/DEAH box helicase, partial [Myxococcales bacterium]|nr:DEAD/DEAH box helicase [Myxococcales bacterium]